MDFVGYEYSDDALPLPQPSLALPLRANIETLGLNFTNFNNLRNLLKNSPAGESATADASAQLAEKYASLSLQALGLGPEPATESTELQARVSNLSQRLSRALNPALPDATVRDLFTRLESKVLDVDSMVDPGVAGSMARKNLRGGIERDLVRSHGAVLAEYSKAIKGLKYLGDRVATLDTLVTETNEMLAQDHSSTKEITNLVNSLTQRRVDINVKKGLLESFRNMYTLNEYEEYVLGSDINQDFLTALARAEEINERCLLLLALDNPQLGLSVMAKNSQLINRALDRILAFCNRSLANLYSLNNKARVDTMLMCLRYLKQRPEHYSAVVSAFVESRQAVLVEEYGQQVNGSESGTSDSRPVFYSSHEPVRFIADLLAYVHSVVVNETETVTSLFADEMTEFASTVVDIVLRILGALAKPIKTTIDRLISVETKLAVLAHMHSHLELYHMMFEKLSHASTINITITETIRNTQEKIVQVVTNRLATVRTSNQAQIDLLADLQPPEWIIDFYSDLLPIVDRMASDTVFGLSEEEHNQFLHLIIDEPIAIFNDHLTLVARTLPRRDVLIFKLNFLDVILSKIMPLRLLSDKVLEINHIVGDYTTELTNSQLVSLLTDCGLSDFYNVVNMICPLDEYFDPSIYQAITENKLFTKEVLLSTDNTIHEILPTALLDIQQALMKINSPMTVSEVITSSSIRFCEFYSRFTEIVDQFLEPLLLTWSGVEVATLLGVEDVWTGVEE